MHWKTELSISLVILSSAAAVYVPISDERTAYPLVVNADTNEQFLWHSGDIHRFLSASAAVRISDRGARFIEHSFTMRELASGYSDWTGEPCGFRLEGLCVLETNATVFDEAAELVVIPDTVSNLVEGSVEYITASVGNCARHANRLVNGGSLYDISLCDVTQKHMDYLLIRDTLLVRKRPEGWVFYIGISLALIVAVTCAAQNISHLLGGESEPVNLFVALVSCVTILVFSIVDNSSLPAFVTREDVSYFWVSVAYIIFYLCMWMGKLAHHSLREQVGEYPVNVLLGGILLGILRLYDGIECSYVLPIQFILCLRAWFKAYSFLASSGIMELENNAPLRDSEFQIAQRLLADGGYADVLIHVMFRASIVFDFMLFGLTHQYGFRTLFYEPHHGDAYAVVLILLSMSLAGVAWRRNVSERHLIVNNGTKN